MYIACIIKVRHKDYIYLLNVFDTKQLFHVDFQRLSRLTLLACIIIAIPDKFRAILCNSRTIEQWNSDWKPKFTC